MSEEFRECPFCRETQHLSVVRVGSNVGDGVPMQVVCRHLDCEDVRGPVAFGRPAAVAAWNRRATPPSDWNDAVEDIAARAEECAEIYGSSTGERNAGASTALRQFATDIRALIRPEQPHNDGGESGDMPPARKALRTYAEASKGTPCPICGGTESCDHTVRERLLADLHATPPAADVSEADVEAAARALCYLDHGDPDGLEPGDVPCIDGYKKNGDPAHFLWRDYVERAEVALRAALSSRTGGKASG